MDTASEGDVTVVSVAGEIDVFSAPELDAELSRQIAVPGRTPLVLVDLDEVKFMDSTGLGVLVKALTGVREASGQLELVVTSENILKLFRITQMSEVFGLHSSRDSALSALSPSA